MGTHPIFESDFDCLTDMGRYGFSVWMGGLPERVRSREIEDFFKGYGRILDVAIKSKYAFIEFEDERDADDAIRDLDDRRLNGSRVRLEKSKGCKDKYVDFQRTGRVRYRSYSREGSPGRRRYRSRSGGPSYRSRSRSHSPRRGSSRRENFYQKPAYKKYGAPEKTKWTVEVDNLSSRCSWQDLKDFMRKAGEVTYGDAHGDCGKNRGLVCFVTKGDMERAVDELDGREINGREVKLSTRIREEWDSGRDRSRSRSRGRRSPSRSRSRSPPPRRSRSGSRRRSVSRGRRSKSNRSDASDRNRSRSNSNRRSRSRSRSR